MEFERDDLHQGFSEQELQQAQTEFSQGLKGLLDRYPDMLQNFAWCAGQIAGDNHAPEQLRAMFEFANKYGNYQHDAIVKAIESASGIRVPMHSLSGERYSGLIVGVGDADGRVLEGVGVVYENGKPIVISIWIYPNGQTLIRWPIRRF